MNSISQTATANTSPISGEAALIAKDLCELQSYVGSIRDDLASLAPDNTPGNHLPQAKHELGAVIATTETAANRILDACLIFETAIKVGELQNNDHLNAALSTIYESCSFQDLTSQRITKVQRILSVVEEKLGSLLSRLGIEPGPPIASIVVGGSAWESSLMNGPAMPGEGIDQANIDAMFD